MEYKQHVEILSRRDLINDFFRLEVAELRHSLYSGEMSAPKRRLSLERGNSAAAVVYHQDLKEYIMVEQFRYPTFSQTGGWLTELVAGTIERGEKPEDCIRREILEETNLSVQSIEFLYDFYTSPGGSSERIFLFHALVSGELNDKPGGSPLESEDIRLMRFSENKLNMMLREGEIVDAKSIIGLQRSIGKR